MSAQGQSFHQPDQETFVGQAEHKSFRLTAPRYMRGKRVKPRLVFLSLIASACAVGMALLSLLGVILFLTTPAGARIGDSWNILLGTLGPPFVVVSVLLAFRVFYARVGLMTLDEASDFPFNGRYPDSWLEPIEGEEEQE